MTDENSLNILILIASAASLLIGLAFVSSLVDFVVNFFKANFFSQRKNSNLERVEREISLLKSSRTRELVNVEGDRKQLLDRLACLSLANSELRRDAIISKGKIEEVSGSYSKLLIENEENRKIVEPLKSKIDILEKDIADIKADWRVAVIERDAIVEAYLVLTKICDEKFENTITLIQNSSDDFDELNSAFVDLKKNLRKDILSLRKSILQLETVFVSTKRSKNKKEFKFD